VRWLARRNAARELAVGGFLSLGDVVSREGDQTGSKSPWPEGSNLPTRLAEFAAELRKESWFDLSDRLDNPGLTRSDGQGLVGILQEFFSKVAERSDGSEDGGDRVRSAVAHAQSRMVNAAGAS
jgi:hypothetical protein